MEDNRVPAYLFKLPDGKLIYVSEVRPGYDEKSFRFFMGSPRKLVKLEILKVNRYFDGGTTIIHTEKGVLYSPTRLKKVDSTWKSGELFEVSLLKLDPGNYDIIEQADRATVTKKKKQ